MKKIVILALVVFGLTEPAMAQFKDQGFVTARVRTDYNSQTEGTSSNPITFVSPCLFATAPCGTGPTVYSATNWFAQNVTGYPQSNFWIMDFNNEPSYNRGGETTSNPGPPNQSIPRSAPGFGLMGFTAITNSLPGESFYRAHLVLNGNFPNPKTNGIPYLAIGSVRSRGNDGIAPGAMNTTYGKKRVQFKARLWDMVAPTQLQGGLDPTLAFYLTATTSWGGKARGIQLALYHWVIQATLSPPDGVDFGTNYKWNWPIQESAYYSGVDWKFIDAEDVQYFCQFSVPRLTTKGQEINYDINLQALFQCLSNLNAWDTPMPATLLYIDSVRWAVEMSGVNGALWPSVHDMKMAQ